MWKFEVRDITEFHYRQLALLVRLGMADAHIIVHGQKVPWPQTNDVTDRRARVIPSGMSIN